MIKMINVVEDEFYLSENGFKMRREYAGTSPNGNAFGGRWVLRTVDDKYIDHDKHRHDLAERHDFKLI